MIHRRPAGPSVALAALLLLAACDRPTATLEPEPLWNGPVKLVNYDAAGAPVVRLDVDGNQMDAHGGEIRMFGGLYYWYAETYGCGFEWQKHAPSPFCGFHLYTSPNLTDWTDRGLLFDVSRWDPWQERCNWWTMGCFRPHVIHNERTGKYVLWVNTYDQPVGYHVLESSTPEGPFVEVALPKLAFNRGPPGQVNNGDQNLFVDEDGTGYIVYAEWGISGGDLVVERLTNDYLSGTGEYVRVGAHHSEAPSLFKHGGAYYIIASTPPNWAYGRSATTYFTASTPLGRWSRPKEISRESCGGQAAHVAQLPTSNGGSWYLFQLDLWINSDGGGAGDANQAPAPQFWTPLSFNRDGEIHPISCRTRFGVDAWTAQSPNPDPPVARLTCDIRAKQGVKAVREFSAIVPTAGELDALEIPVYQRGEPDAPLLVEVVSPTGSAIRRGEVHRQVGTWEDPPIISWAARKLRVPVSTRVAEGERIALRLSSASTRGCYGFAFRDGIADAESQSRMSTDGGLTWSTEPGRQPLLTLDLK